MSGRIRTQLVGSAAALLRPRPPAPRRGGRGPCLVTDNVSYVTAPVSQARGLHQSRLACSFGHKDSRRAFSRTHGRWAWTPQDQRQAGPAKKSSTPRRPSLEDASQIGRLMRAHPQGDGISLTFENYCHENPVSLPLVWFRDLCQCAHCVSGSSGQKRFATCDIDSNPKVQSCGTLDDGSLEVVWADDFMSREGERTHTSVYPMDLLRRLLMYAFIPETYRPQRLVWDRATFQKDMDSRTVSYADWMAGGPVFAEALLSLIQWGLVVVKDVPETMAAVKDIANKIGALQSTFYGLTWDVISKPNAENVAYTNEFLCLHQDLLYWRGSPKVQLLHCLANECEGGDSLFSDGFRAAAEFRIRRPGEFQVLSERRVLFHYMRNGNFYRHPHVVIPKPKSAFLPKRINWSPPFQAPFPPAAMDGDNKFVGWLPKWSAAARSFRDSLEAPENMLQYRLQPGDCVLFDNHRILHGRTQFDASAGRRHLHGAYLDGQTLNSALTRVVSEGHIHLSPNDRDSRAKEKHQAYHLYGEADKPDKE